MGSLGVGTLTPTSLTGGPKPPTLGESHLRPKATPEAHLAHPGRLACTLLPEGSCSCCPSTLHK